MNATTYIGQWYLANLQKHGYQKEAIDIQRFLQINVLHESSFNVSNDWHCAMESGKPEKTAINPTVVLQIQRLLLVNLEHRLISSFCNDVHCPIECGKAVKTSALLVEHVLLIQQILTDQFFAIAQIQNM
jgi:hypothetical protein